MKNLLKDILSEYEIHQIEIDAPSIHYDGGADELADEIEAALLAKGYRIYNVSHVVAYGIAGTKYYKMMQNEIKSGIRVQEY
jgi:hypothetical protein